MKCIFKKHLDEKYDNTNDKSTNDIFDNIVKKYKDEFDIKNVNGQLIVNCNLDKLMKANNDTNR